MIILNHFELKLQPLQTKYNPIVNTGQVFVRSRRVEPVGGRHTHQSQRHPEEPRAGQCRRLPSNGRVLRQAARLILSRGYFHG